jgi:hypothetical protein
MSVPKPHIKRELCWDGVTRYFFETERGFCVYGGYEKFGEAVRAAAKAHNDEVRYANKLKGCTYLFGKDAIFVITL